MRLPHPAILLIAGVGLCALLTWVLPAGSYERHQDAGTGREVVVAGTYHAVDPQPVGPFKAAVAIPRGFIDAAEIIGIVLFAGAAWFVVDRIGTLGRLINALASALGGKGMLAVSVISLFFATMGALENMQEEIIPLVPGLLLLARRLRVDAVSAVAMSMGAAMVGSAFSPANPFQAGLAMRLAELPPMSEATLRWTMCVVAVTLWIAWTTWCAARSTGFAVESAPEDETRQTATVRDCLVLVVVLLPIAAYVYGAYALGWGFNELSGGFLVAGCVAGFLGGLGVAGTTALYLQGMQALLPAAVLVGLARALSVVLTDGHVIDTIVHALAMPLATMPPRLAALSMIPLHAVIHVPVSSLTGHAVLTMPILVPLSDLLGVSRQATVLAYQTGAGLTELVTPTNGPLMAGLLAAGVSFGQWIKFVLPGLMLALLVGIAGMIVILR